MPDHESTSQTEASPQPATPHPLSYFTPERPRHKYNLWAKGTLVFAVLSVVALPVAVPAFHPASDGVAVVLALAGAAFICGLVSLSLDRSRANRITIIGIALICGGITIGGICLERADQADRRRLAYSIHCQSNLRQIYMAAMMYADDHGGRWPGQLSDLLETGSVGSDVFVCLATTDTPATGATPHTRAENLHSGGHLSYIYLGAGLPPQPSADIVFACETAVNHLDGTTLNVLFGDGHVTRVRMPQARAILDQIASGVRPARFPATQPTTVPAPVR